MNNPTSLTAAMIWKFSDTVNGEGSDRYLEGDINDPETVLEKIASKSDIKRAVKAGTVKVSTEGGLWTWVKYGKEIYVIVPPGDNPVARAAQIWWEYHFQLKPKSLSWTTLQRKDQRQDNN